MKRAEVWKAGLDVELIFVSDRPQFRNTILVSTDRTVCGRHNGLLDSRATVS